nr:methyltransferase domain-containing protein [Desulfobacterales bacterium]
MRKYPGMSARERWLVSHVKGKIVIDIGFAGQKPRIPTYFTFLKEIHCDSLIIGIDNNRDVVLDRKQKESLVGNAQALPLRTESVDCVILGEFLEHHSCITNFLEECQRVLKVEGHMLITTPNPFFSNRLFKSWLLQLGESVFRPSNILESMGHNDHLVLWDPLSLCNLLLRSGFKLNEVTTLGSWIPWLARAVPRFRKGFYLNLWPVNRIGHITCIKCSKVKT